jgi:hypothetical protein
MKKVLFLLSSVLTGCLVYEQPSYPSLDGTYVVTCVTIECDELDIFEEHCENTTVFTQLPSTPLDTLKINKTKIHISGNEIYMKDYLFNGQVEWSENYPLRINQDLITGAWSHLSILYPGREPRTYRITEDGLEYLILSYTQELSSSATYNYILTFQRQGP